MLNTVRGLILSLLTGSFFLPAIASAGGFPISLARTNSSLHLQATTVPAGRVVWLQGSQPDAVTNVVQIEGVPLVQHDFPILTTASPAFFRAAMFDTNVERAPFAVGQTHSLAILTNGMIVCWGDNSLGQFGNNAPVGTMDGSSVACWVYTIPINTSRGPLLQSTDAD
jgi:hypothetical protein